MDLAGSEPFYNQGNGPREGATINKSLLFLSNVIARLSSTRKTYINFRDSKLTRILKNELQGQSKISLICCVSQLSCNVQETLQTLQFGNKAKSVKPVVKPKEAPSTESLQREAYLNQQIAQYRTQLAMRDKQLRELT